MNALSTVSIPDEYLKGMLADLILCGPHSKDLCSLDPSGVTTKNLPLDTFGTAGDVDRTVRFLSQITSAILPLNCNFWRWTEANPPQWFQAFLTLQVRLVKSIEADDVSRPLLSSAEVDNLLEITSNEENWKQLYAFSDCTKVNKFVQANDFLVGLLKDAYGELRKIFPENKLRLEHRIDPEVPDDDKLLIWVESYTGVEETLAKLDEFEELWWLDNLEKACGKLLIDVEFV